MRNKAMLQQGQQDDIWNEALFIKVRVFILGMLRGISRVEFVRAFSAQHDAVSPYSPSL